MAKPVDLEQAMKNPAAHFGTPAALVAHAGLTKAQKIALLRQWEYEESEIAVSLEEGMPGAESRFLQQIAAALATLDPGGDDTSPTKQRASPSP